MDDANSEKADADQTSAFLFAKAYPSVLRDREEEILRARRAGAKISQDLGQQVGFGLSGGGIRSATFALGVFQALAKRGLVRDIDYLSTVSGGGYFGAFLGRLLTRTYVKDPDDVDQILVGKEKPEILRFLRENGRYMSPNGGGDSLIFGATLMRNWVSIQVVLALFLLSLFLGLQMARGVFSWLLRTSPDGPIHHQVRTMLSSAREAGSQIVRHSLPNPFRVLLRLVPHEGLIWWSPLVALSILTFFLWAFPAGWSYWLIEPRKRPGGSRERSRLRPVYGLVFAVASSLWLTTLCDATFLPLWIGLILIAVLAFLFWRLAVRGSGDPSDTSPEEDLFVDQRARNRATTYVMNGLIATAFLLALGVIDSLGQSLYAVAWQQGGVRAWLLALFSSLGALAGFARWIAMAASNGSKGKRPPLSKKLLASVAATILLLLVLVPLNALSHAIAWRFNAPEGLPKGLLILVSSTKASTYQVPLHPQPESDLKVEVVVPPAATAAAADPKEPYHRDPVVAATAFLLIAFLSFLFGYTWPFVNRSSHQPLYSARLTRAYLGASNEVRFTGNQVTEPLRGDDIDLKAYWPPTARNGAPIHLINVTINETIDGRSQVQQQDRKGVGLAIGPWGMSAGVEHHLVEPFGRQSFEPRPRGEGAETNDDSTNRSRVFPESPPPGNPKPYQVFDYPERPGPNRFTGEPLPLGAWTSISGAAFSTGIGMQTSVGLSLLCGFGNVRLGRWWYSGVSRGSLREEMEKAESGSRAPEKLSVRLEKTLSLFFPVQIQLLSEFLARFPGTARRHWYLSDGGHFENMGGYELLRRRLKLIVIVDGEMDPDYTFEGLANMVRKARIDFGAEVRFLDADELDEHVDRDARPYFGTLQQLRRGTWEGRRLNPDKNRFEGELKGPSTEGASLAHAALARISYGSDPEKVDSWLLYVKPTLTGREPVDIQEYHRAHSQFPHETTLDQFFDEAQWESYRRLGQYIGDGLFGKVERLLPQPSVTAHHAAASSKAVRSPESGGEPERAKRSGFLRQWNWKPTEGNDGKSARGGTEKYS